jgi:excisionase family DNA binding protein
MSAVGSLTGGDVADLLGLSTDQVHSLAREKDICAEADGGSWRFSRRELENWIARHPPADNGTDSGTSPGNVPTFNVVKSDNLDHYRAQPGNWNVQVSKLSKGVFRSHIRSIRLPGIVVYDNHWGCASLVQGQSPDDLLMLGGIVSPERASIRWCGQRADSRHYACTSRGKAIEFTVDSDVHDVVVLISPQLLERTAGPEAVDAVARTHLIDFESAGGGLIDLVMNLLHHCESKAPLLQQPAIAGSVHSQLLRSIEDCFAGPVQNDAIDSSNLRERAVHAALDHVYRTGRSVSAFDMAQAAGVSQRTLELAFKQSLGMTPGKYLVLNRLNGAHHQLADACKGEQTVTEVALSWGFTHVGRFSSAYLQLFGELPSNTLVNPAAH